MSIMIFPGVIGKFLQSAKSAWVASSATWVTNLFQNNWFYGVAYFILVVFFTYFYTSFIFQPKDMAENLQKQGGFIPGIRPGPETESYLSKIITRITLSGALFLGVIAVLPFIAQAVTGINTIVLGGTGVLIMVSVIIETMRQIQAQLLMRSYENY
jgi:preprotein translocase subunit SecY